jgi:CxxC motif-containing protein
MRIVVHTIYNRLVAAMTVARQSGIPVVYCGRAYAGAEMSAPLRFIVSTRRVERASGPPCPVTTPMVFLVRPQDEALFRLML